MFSVMPRTQKTYVNILKMCKTWWCVATFTPWLPYPLGTSPDTHQIGGYVGCRVGMDYLEKKMSFVSG